MLAGQSPMQSRGWESLSRISCIPELLRCARGLPHKTTEESRLLGESLPLLEHQQQERPDVSDRPRLLHIYDTKFTWALAEMPRLQGLAEELSIGAIHSIWRLLSVGPCAHQHAHETLCGAADLMDLGGPLPEHYPTALKTWMRVVEEVNDRQELLVELQELDRAQRLQAEQQKLGVCLAWCCRHFCLASCGQVPTKYSAEHCRVQVAQPWWSGQSQWILCRLSLL